MTIEIREAEAADGDAIRKLVYEAFVGNEPLETAEFVEALRSDPCMLAEWLASDASGPVGYIAFSRVSLEAPSGESSDAVLLTPLAVRPDRQRNGIGLRLMHHGLSRLDARGEGAVFVLGHPGYYPRAGFRSAFAAGIASPWGDEPAFMVRGTQVPRGRLVLPKVIADAH